MLTAAKLLGAGASTDNYVYLSITISVIGFTYCVYSSFNYLFYNERQIDATRVQEGLPTDISLTPEDFANNPELAEIFGVTDTDNNLDLILESNQHFEAMQLQNQNTAIDLASVNTLYDIMEALISAFF